jgi:hypothetical protein
VIKDPGPPTCAPGSGADAVADWPLVEPEEGDWLGSWVLLGVEEEEPEAGARGETNPWEPGSEPEVPAPPSALCTPCSTLVTEEPSDESAFDSALLDAPSGSGTVVEVVELVLDGPAGLEPAVVAPFAWFEVITPSSLAPVGLPKTASDVVAAFSEPSVQTGGSAAGEA